MHLNRRHRIGGRSERRLAFGAVSARGVTRWMGRSRPSLPRCAGLLTNGCERSMQPYRSTFLAGLRDFGYVEGQNLTIEYRFALGQTKSYDELAQELIRLDPPAIVLTGTPAALALKRQTTTIPIVLAPIADPIALGLARSLARPGGNVTGVTMYGTELAHKRMEIFK